MEKLDVAITGTRKMLELSNASNARYIFFSSSEIYDDPEIKNVPTPKSYRGSVSWQGSRACYGESKRVDKTITYIFHNQTVRKTNMIRPSNIFGPEILENDCRVLPNFASKIKKVFPCKYIGVVHKLELFATSQMQYLEFL